MSFQYEITEENGQVFDGLTDLLNQVRIRICRTGAEPVSISKRDSSDRWHGFLYRDGMVGAPASGWGNHATVMGYFTHRLWKEQSTYRGHDIRGGNHGFLRHFSFDAPERHSVEAGELIYHIPSDRIPKEAYPYKVSLQLSYKLLGEWLEVQFIFSNEEQDVDAHLSFGMHPGFAVSAVESFHFIMPEGKYRLLEAPGNFLNGKSQVIEHVGGEMPFSRKTLSDSYLLDLREVPDRRFVLEDPIAGRKMDLDYREIPYLTLWSDGNPFFCAEPCWGLPDSNPPVDFDHKAGIQSIAPGGVLKKSFRLRPGFLIK